LHREFESKHFKSKNSWFIDAINLLKSEDISICNHEYKDQFEEHRIKGGSIEIIDLIEENVIMKSAQSRRLKNVIFLEQLLENDNTRLMKWKHFCMENEINSKGKTPSWFLKVKEEVTVRGSRNLKEKYIKRNLKKDQINLKLFDEMKKFQKVI
jgi:hypothetical protein